MKFLRRLSGLEVPLTFQLLLISFLITGCGARQQSYDSSQVGSAFEGSPAGPTDGQPGLGLSANVFQIGDMVTVTFSGTQTKIDPHEERITEDGTITPFLIGPVKAVGKTAGELQKEIYDLYVPKYYSSNSAFNVTVQAPGRAYYVGGEVKDPGPKAYIGKTTVIKAIQAAGDLTDFANKRKIQLTRPDGTSIIVNYNKALKKPEFDPEVYPGDRIYVPRSIW